MVDGCCEGSGEGWESLPRRLQLRRYNREAAAAARRAAAPGAGHAEGLWRLRIDAGSTCWLRSARQALEPSPLLLVRRLCAQLTTGGSQIAQRRLCNRAGSHEVWGLRAAAAAQHTLGIGRLSANGSAAIHPGPSPSVSQ